MPTYYAQPQSVDPATPTIVLAMHLWGVDKQMRATADRFAAAGFATIVPDLYAELDAPSGDGANDYRQFVPFAQKLSADTVEPEIRNAALILKEHFSQTKTAIAGFCMGGIMALRRTSGFADLFAAAAVWYGAITPDADPKRVDIPIVGSYGADDTGIPVESVRSFFADLPVDSDLKIYPGAGHAFCDDERDTYQAQAAEDSWRRSIAFLRKYLLSGA